MVSIGKSKEKNFLESASGTGGRNEKAERAGTGETSETGGTGRTSGSGSTLAEYMGTIM